MATSSVPTRVVAQISHLLGEELWPAQEGQEARVFFGDGHVVKVYGPHESHVPAQEAANLARAGLGEWLLRIIGAAELNGYAALVLRRFDGKPFSARAFASASLAELGGFLLRLHRLPEPGQTSVETARKLLASFRESLVGLPQAQKAIARLEPRAHVSAGVPHSFVHHDLWAGNVLLSAQGRVLVVDWSRAGAGDPARDLAILTTGSLSLLGWEDCLGALMRLARNYPEPLALWRRLAFWIPLTFLHDLHWFSQKRPESLTEALADKLPRLERSLNRFPYSPW